MQRVCLNMHCLCSFDNRLCNLTDKNWWLTLASSSIQLTITLIMNILAYLDYLANYLNDCDSTPHKTF